MRIHPIRTAAFLVCFLVPLFLTAQQNHSDDDPSAAPGITAAPPTIQGVTLSGVLKNEFWNALAGGMQQGTGTIAHGEVYIDADLEQLLGVHSTRMFVQLLANNGGGISNRTGDLQMVSNLEGYRTAKVYQWWIEHDVPSIATSFLFGIFDLNAEFYVTPASGPFLNGSHGIGIDLGQTGASGPSVYPNTALAFRTRTAATDRLSFSAAVVDGHPGAADDCNRFDLTVSTAEGFLLITESDYRIGESSKAGVGVWYYTGGYADACPVTGDPILRSDNAGAYFLSDLQLSESVSFFARGGVANQHLNAVQYHIGTGMTWTGLWDSRPDDFAGFAVALASFGADHRAIGSGMGEGSGPFESAHELTYRAVLAPWCAVQGDLQYIVHPSGRTGIHHALVSGVRLELVL